MAGETIGKSQGQERRFARMPLAGIVHYICAPNDGGIGSWQDVGRGGACIRLDRDLRPGDHVLLSVKLGSQDGAYAELKGKVVWSRRCRENGSFVAGLRVFDDRPEAELTLSGLINEGLGQAGGDNRAGAGPAWHKRVFAGGARQRIRHTTDSNGLRLSDKWTGKGLNLSPLSGIL